MKIELQIVCMHCSFRVNRKKVQKRWNTELKEEKVYTNLGFQNSSLTILNSTWTMWAYHGEGVHYVLVPFIGSSL